MCRYEMAYRFVKRLEKLYNIDMVIIFGPRIQVGIIVVPSKFDANGTTNNKILR